MEKLNPPNLLPHFVLPPLDQPSSTRANAHGAIHKVFPHGIQFIDQMAMIEGFLAMIFGGAALMYLIFFFKTSFYLSSNSFVFKSDYHSLFYIIVAAILARPDFVGYRYQPVLFNRAEGKVHVFLDEGTRWWEVWRWFGWTHHWCKAISCTAIRAD